MKMLFWDINSEALKICGVGWLIKGRTVNLLRRVFVWMSSRLVTNAKGLQSQKKLSIYVVVRSMASQSIIRANEMRGTLMCNGL